MKDCETAYEEVCMDALELKERNIGLEQILSQIVPQANFIISRTEVPFIRGAAKVILFLIDRTKDGKAIKVCRWKENEFGSFSTECGGEWSFEADGLAENRCVFCPFCGGEIKEDERGKDSTS